MSKMTKRERRQRGIRAREELRQLLVEHTGCEIQTGRVGNRNKDYGWCCGTCFMSLLSDMGLDCSDPQYSEKNEGHDRHNEVWRAVLQMRDKKL